QVIVARDDDLPGVRGVDLVVNCGEIVAIAGVEGNGQTELVEAIVGLRKTYSGEIHLCGKDVTNLNLARRAKLGLAFIPADRLRHGIVPGFTLWENCLLGWQRSDAFGRHARLNTRATRRFARNLLRDFDVRPGNAELRAGALSGGNQQRLVLARELARDPRLLVAAHPTRGLDIVSTEFVLRRLVAARNAGKGVLFVSSELDQVIEIADRVVVMFRGRFPGEFRKGRIDEKQLGFLMCGGASAAEDDSQMKKLSRWKKGVIVGFVAAFPIIAAGLVAAYYAIGGKDIKNRLSNRFFPKPVEDRLAFSAEKTREFLRRYDLAGPPSDIRLLVKKSERKLELHSGGRVLKTYRIGLGKRPTGRKEREGDKRTPVGEYYVCTRNDKSKFFLFLGLSYPNEQDSGWGMQNKLIDEETNREICAAIDRRACPPWDTALGGEVGIHGSGGSTDWTLGCIALDDEDIAELWGLIPLGTPVTIVE
ncbi:MAG: ATP-binding cassette domain-containing protein, partial [Planctomycetota bacterium]|nr:ATP-binding cassette domain-containing protein [Planctomycetota bacterium]